jgi:hypothetical protein
MSNAWHFCELDNHGPTHQDCRSLNKLMTVIFSCHCCIRCQGYYYSNVSILVPLSLLYPMACLVCCGGFWRLFLQGADLSAWVMWDGSSQ